MCLRLHTAPRERRPPDRDPRASMIGIFSLFRSGVCRRRLLRGRSRLLRLRVLIGGFSGVSFPSIGLLRRGTIGSILLGRGRVCRL